MSLKERILKYWFIISSILIGVMYFIIDNRNRRLSKAVADVQTSKLAGKLEDIKSRAIESERDYEEYQNQYDSLKRQHADLLKRLGITR